MRRKNTTIRSRNNCGAPPLADRHGTRRGTIPRARSTSPAPGCADHPRQGLLVEPDALEAQPPELLDVLGRRGAYQQQQAVEETVEDQIEQA
jgi:hypothetical protein